ncbi:AAA family ATPase [Desertifilum sp. FACHB-1129]|uniref:Excinuclease n=1 Tax=Desertifilum tharense IPPAS B-1220 TaxID=1781255 RepID=A0A1E5QNV5_9CYAN|nr:MULTISPECIES: AAA family ATPase [unclassified Desertifilum]MDA0212252.1 AAA family ATPase [Cyanobacteria bacterium FC1]OEJ76294.1 excinuclease [Desertifilum tharense IPPAS B-1220]MBD2312832.1 AAA family ATPase [Desertifilum sp. FACHB-1129]MBD2324196.1 AAA family ATPase [Desertifilum sp. FACHB-866]MBD2334210.1 AAA family ATPase [Desertifilum sp. FACHB-868]
MQIQKISVNGLFGIFDHVIPLNMDERITIIHGPNGFGKTAMLRMLNGFFNSQYSIFRNIPFAKFRVDFDNGKSVEVLKKSKSLEKIKHKERLIIDFYDKNEKKFSFPLEEINNTRDLNFSVSILDNIPGLRRVGSKVWQYIPTGETLSLNDVIDRFEDILPLKTKLREEPEWLDKLKSDSHVRLIESQRLLNFVPSRSSRLYPETPSMLQTVSAYSEEVAQLIQSKLAEYGTTSQSLDRTFPVRVVQQKPSPDVTNEQLRQQLNELEETRSRLIEVGLLDRDDNSDFQIQPEFIDESTKNILSVYVEDVENKLSVFNEIARKIELLRRIVNKKFSYSYKEMSFDNKKGFIFKTLYRPKSSSLETIFPTDLSSGEQHELVLLYELLFKVKPNSLVLIDEPELSLHVGWQAQFIKDLQEITKLADLNVLMATHSPDIIQDRWDLTVELKGPEK